jgi:hypothetical protein
MEKKLSSIFICTLLFTMLATTTVISDEEEINYAGRDTTVAQSPYIPSSSPILDRSDIFYASNLHDNDNLVYFDPATPGIFNVIAPSSATDFLAAGDFVEDTWYAAEYSDVSAANLWTIDHITGTMTLIGDTGLGLNGLAWDDVTQTLYGCSGTDLYSINPLTAASALIGAMGNGGGTMIGIAFDKLGNMYGEDLGDDNFYSINPTTGAATIIGSLGIDLNYAQDMAFDKDDNICYITGYKGSTAGGGALYSVSTSTGLATFIGNFPIGTMGAPSEVAAFAIPYTLAQNVSFSGLQSNWNLVSIPVNQTVNLTDLQVEYLGTNYTWSNAVTNTIIDAKARPW